MKKTLLLSILSFIILATEQLNAYCVYNLSPNNNDEITVFTGSFGSGGKHELPPGPMPKPNEFLPNKKCWNWSEIDKNNPNKVWEFRIYKKNTRTRKKRGSFPINGAIAFYGYNQNNQAIVYVYDKNGNPWEG